MTALEHALELAEEFGLPVFPCRATDVWIGDRLDKKAKSPLPTHGHKDASRNIEQISEWWARWPDALVGVPTGHESKLFVVDVDPGGRDWYLANSARLGCGRVHQTARGHHLLYTMPNGGITIGVSKISPGVDHRGEGGYVIWWPAAGYPATGELMDLTAPPEWLLELLDKPEPTKAADNGAHKVGEGGRHEALKSAAASLRRKGLSGPVLEAALQAWNVEHCEPPQDAADVARLALDFSQKDGDPLAVWIPPAISTYGAAFDAAKIPLRRWLVGRRRSIGEVTVDAGPPGVNKSTLMICDAVAITTGRKILADDVHERGEVLYLAGEDARRDVEARLAGILAHFHIPAAELDDKLHVVYLAEIDPLAYTLADMAEDMATLNMSMLTWLREYPGAIAVFIDPLAAWHRLIENSNEALQLLCTSLRSIAVQGNRHVGVDHHVTKITMADPEGHVGNLAAVRGAGSIMAYTRWAFTLAKLNEQTAAAHGILEEERRCYRRLDALKASYGPDDDHARLLRVESVPIANGESVGVLVEVDTERTRADAYERKAVAATEAQKKLAGALTRMLAERRPRTASAAALWLITQCPELVPGKNGEPLAEFTVRQRLPRLIGQGVATTHNGKPARVVMRPGRGRAGSEIDFEQSEAPL
jgi:hypothetical protein